MIVNNAVSPISMLTTAADVASGVRKATPAEVTDSFASYLKTALDGVASQEKQVHTMNDLFIIGEVNAEQVMVAATQAQLSLSLTAQVRNKVVEAYQEIMRTTI